MNELIWIVLCLFGSIGLAQCIGWLTELRRHPKGMRRGYHVVTLYDDPDRIEAQLRYGVSRLGWNSSGVVLLLDMGLEGESVAICDRFIRQNPGMMRCDTDGLVDAIRDLDALQDIQSPDMP